MSAARSLGPGGRLDRRTRRWSAAGSLLQPLIFYPLWISMLIPLMVRRDQIDSLSELRCDIGQGYFFARPLDGDAMTALLAGRPTDLAPEVPAPQAASD